MTSHTVACMPKATPLLRSLRKEAGDSTERVAEVVGLIEGTWRNVENLTQPADEHRFHRAAAYYSERLGRRIAAESLIAKDDKQKEEKSGGAGSGPQDNRPPTKDRPRKAVALKQAS